jgi:hypothetical protein
MADQQNIHKMNQRNVKVEFRVAATFLLSLVILTMVFFDASAQTCTIAGSGDIEWDNTTPPSCQEIGVTTATASILVIPVGVNLIFNNNADTWRTGSILRIGGALSIPTSGSQIRIDANIEVLSTGTLSSNAKLQLGADFWDAAALPPPGAGIEPGWSNCNYNITVVSGGKIDLSGTASDRLVICGRWMLSGKSTGGNCFPYPAGPPPYCEPTIPNSWWDGPIGFDKNGSNPLPVKLLFFKAFTGANSVQLKWATASERNSEYFVIEKSRDGRDFQEVGRVPSAGNTIARVDYDFLDEDVLLGRNYYRLKQVDFDGSYEYFNITFADTDGKRAVSLYPNPVQHTRIQFKLNFASDEQSHAKIYNSTGVLVSSFSFSGTHYNEESNLRPGAYVLKVSVGNELFTQRFVIP